MLGRHASYKKLSGKVWNYFLELQISESTE